MSPRVWLASAALIAIGTRATRAEAPPTEPPPAAPPAAAPPVADPPATIPPLAPAPTRARPGAIVRLAHAGANPTLGPRHALVTMELYFVPGSDEGHAAYATVAALAARHPTRLRAVFRPRQLGARHQVAALALAAHRHGRFFALMDALVAAGPAPTPAASLELAVSLGLDRETLRRADRDPVILRTIAGNEHRAFLAPTTEVPELVINGQPTSSAPVRVTVGSTTVAALESLYQSALADARVAAAQGIAPGTLPRWGRWQTWCASDEPEPMPPSVSRWLSTREPPPPAADPDPGPRFAWHLRGLIERGTACAPPDHRPARLDDHLVFSEPISETPFLLATPLPLAGLPSLGPADAAVPVAIVCNLHGESCRAQLGLLRPLVDLYEGRVRLVWLPHLSRAYDPAGRGDDLGLAQAAICAAAHGDGWPFASDPSGVWSGPVTIDALARAAGAVPEAVDACAAAGEGPARRAANAARAAGLVWGPTVVIGGRTYLGGFIDIRAAAAAIERELAPGLLEQLTL